MQERKLPRLPERSNWLRWGITLMLALLARAPAAGQVIHLADRPRLFLPEQRQIEVREPSQFHTAGAPVGPAPRTVAAVDEDDRLPEVHLTLDEAIRTALANSEVVRILSGVMASSTGQTIYSVAIANTAIDQEQARFDPAFTSRHDFDRFESPVGILEPLNPAGARIGGTRTDDYDTTTGVTKTTQTGGTAAFNVNANPARFRPGVFPLNPQTRYSLDLSYTQPLYRGGGIHANRAPIVIARLDAERSFFQYKESVQQMVRSVVAGYWALVFARTDEWARRKQVEQAKFAYDRAVGQRKVGLTSVGSVAQARVSLANFQANLTAAENNVLLREAALRNVMGLPPADGKRLVPVTPPAQKQVDFDWQRLVALGETYRPDLIEAKLVIEADEQQRLIALNNAHPNVDATMLYRWNGLNGRTPSGAHLSTDGGQFTDWTLGVTFSVPLTLRQQRAELRRTDLIIAQDRAFLRQGIHNMTHNLAASLRNLEQYHQQYREFHSVREAAQDNVQELKERWKGGGVGTKPPTYVEVLLAITDWGNTISAEAAALTNYNTELANLETETGTILEAHGIAFFEERNGHLGPLGKFGKPKPYPAATPPTPNTDRYSGGTEPAENFFDLSDPLTRRDEPKPEELPPPLRQSRLRERLRRG